MTRIRLLAIALGFWVLAPGVFGQVNVDVVLDQEQYLPNEPLMVGVRVTNLSGQPLKLGADQAWLQFSVEPRDANFIVAELAEPGVEGEFLLESSKMATKTVDLAPCFSLTRTGRYQVTATVRIAQWDKVITSQPKMFDIISGVRIWERQFGVPLTGGGNSAPEVRKYILQKATYLKQLRIYVRVMDQNENTTYRVFPLGNTVSFGQPEAQVDKDCNLHVLNQFGSKSFLYCVVDPYGAQLVRQTHEYTSTSRPMLKLQPDGHIRVGGGIRRFSHDDYPPRTLETKSPTNAPAADTYTD
jgi:hypothetical protein